jgi:hypothetical protein
LLSDAAEVLSALPSAPMHFSTRTERQRAGTQVVYGRRNLYPRPGSVVLIRILLSNAKKRQSTIVAVNGVKRKK